MSAGLALGPAPAQGSLPIYEGQTPAGFSRSDSTAQSEFVEGSEITVRVDLNQAVTPTYPAVGHFHSLERSEPLETRDVDGLRADIAVDAGGVVHVAWISQEVILPVTTPAYNVRYARSNNRGATFSQPVSVSGSLRFDILTIDGNGPSFSTLDLEVDSRGNPRVVYAFNHSADGNTARFSSNTDNVYFSYSETGGAVWLPADNSIVVNDVTGTAGNTEGRRSGFPRLVVDQRDNVYITYVRGASRGGVGGTDDIMVTKVNRETSPFTMEKIGSAGTVGSSGGVRITPDGDRQTGPDMALGTGDVLHIAYFNDDGAVPANSEIQHKTLVADFWSRVDVSGWNQASDGAGVDDFNPKSGAAQNAALNRDAIFYFPTIVVDQQSSPNRVYVLYKYADAALESVFFNQYVYDNAKGGGAGWNKAQAAAVWSTATSPLFKNGNTEHNIELDWTVTDRVSAVVDDRRWDRGELHIAFTAGYSNSAGGGAEHDVYCGYYNGVSWTLPEKVADDDSDGSGTEDGIAAADVFLDAPVIAKSSGDDNLYMVFTGGAGEGLGVRSVTDVNQHAYFKVLGRDVTSEDESIPPGGFQYDLTYTPINPHDAGSTGDANHAVYVHVADYATGEGLGATGKQGDGFLAGDWETVGTTLGNDDTFFEGESNDDEASDHEWGDDDDKIGLLVKLNVLGSDSSTNLQAVTNSTASSGASAFGARTVRVGSAPTVSFLATGAGSFFALGADIDIIDSNTAPTVEITQPDGVADTASTAYLIKYSLTDPDDDMDTGNLTAALYFSSHSGLSTVQDVRIFGTLIADENDDSSVFASGTGDFSEGRNQSYSWDDPPTALKAKLFASIQQAPGGDYYIYLVGDDQKNRPVLARSPGPLTILHKPIVVQVDPTGLDTVDTGARTGSTANPYDLDFLVRDFDRQGATQVALYYSEVSGLTSVSTSGTYPNLRFALGKSLAGTRGVLIPGSDTLTSVDTELSWDVTDSVVVNGSGTTVGEGGYFLYAVASDSANVTVGRSNGQLIVKHSPSMTFYEPLRDTHRQINTGSQPVYTVQWQKGPGDDDFDDDANIDLFYTTDNPATINYEEFPDSLLKDSSTRRISTGISENGDRGNDMYVWDLLNPPRDVPSHGDKIWLYAVVSDDHSNKTEVLGGALTVTHTPYINLLSSDLDDLSSFDKYDVLRLSWEDYMVDDGLSTDDAYIRLYATESPSAFSSLQTLDSAIDGVTTFLINSSNGMLTGQIDTVRESSNDFYDWNTKLFGNTSTNYDIYAAISADNTFINNTAGGIQLSKSSSPLSIQGTGSLVNISISPTDVAMAVGDTVTFDVMVQHDGPINLVQIVIELDDTDFLARDLDNDQNGTQPFVDLGNVFAGTSPIENQVVSGSGVNQLRFTKSTFSGEVVGTTTKPTALARFQLVVRDTWTPALSVAFSTGATGIALGLVGNPNPYHTGTGLTRSEPNLTVINRGQIATVVELEGRTIAPATGDNTTYLDVHLRLPGSTIDIDDAGFIAQNDQLTGTTDTVEVQILATGGLTLTSVPAGRYVLTVKDTSHLSGRSDTITVRNGETVTISSGNANGFFGSDLRGDATALLPAGGNGGSELTAGDASEDNEINEDDVNLIMAAWGTGQTAPSFAQADMNNDKIVGVADLTVTTSNFGNSQGFGAPPVYKPVGGQTGLTPGQEAWIRPGSAMNRATPRGDNSGASLEILPLFDSARPLRRGEMMGLEIAVRELDDLAGYELDLHFDERALRPMPGRFEAGDVFAPNPRGSAFDTRVEDGILHVISSRIGKEWSATGEGSLVRLWFQILDEDLSTAIEPGDGILINPGYEPVRATWSQSLTQLLVPARASLDQNYPNPFNPSTTIPFALPSPQAVHLQIYNALGQRIRTLMVGPMESGFHTIVWNGQDDAGRAVAAGLYISLLETADFRQTRKMLLVK